MFVSRDYPSQAYTVTLASGQRSIVTGTGHGYRYFPDDERGRYIGEARPLRATFNPFPKQALLPLFG
jgi:hypothetical protein